MITVLIISLFGLMAYGSAYNSSQSWYDLKVITIQPSEIGKIFVILYLAYYYNKHKNNLDNQWTLLKPIIISSIIIATVAMQPDLGTAFVIFGIVLLILCTTFKKTNKRSNQ